MLRRRNLVLASYCHCCTQLAVFSRTCCMTDYKHEDFCLMLMTTCVLCHLGFGFKNCFCCCWNSRFANCPNMNCRGRGIAPSFMCSELKIERERCGRYPKQGAQAELREVGQPIIYGKGQLPVHPWSSCTDDFVDVCPPRFLEGKRHAFFARVKR